MLSKAFLQLLASLVVYESKGFFLKQILRKLQVITTLHAKKCIQLKAFYENTRQIYASIGIHLWTI